MKFTVSWLKRHLDTEADLDTLSIRLTALGLEVDDIEDAAQALAPFVVAHVVSAEQHPNADKLRVCMVDYGGEAPIQVVCGAPNARTGMTGVFAPVGTDIPGTGIRLKKGVIRGVESNGMLLSEREMGLSDEHTGIVDLETELPVGTPAAEAMGLDDPLIIIGLTPNRQDCAGVRGIARDLAAAGVGTLKPLDTTSITGSFTSPIGVSIRDEAQQACPAFIGRYIRGVKNGPSPAWLQEKLRSVGLRPISTLVDITNWTTMDLARPLHVFDADAVSGDIHVRFAREGETLAALNDKTYDLASGMTAIADDDGVLGLGGIIGGESSGVTEETVNVFVECAVFDPIRTAATGRTLQIESDARYRFERGIDPAFMAPAMEHATRLILDLCGGEPSDVVMAGTIPGWQRTILLRPTRVAHLGGIDIPVARQTEILERLGFAVSEAEDGLHVVPPSWRRDIEGEADLVEEVLRVEGYDAIPTVAMAKETAVTRPALSTAQKRRVLARRALIARGLDEAVTWSFMPSGVASHFGQISPALKLLNPISSDLDVMRPSVLPNLIQAVGRNAARGFGDVGLVEVGPAYRDAGEKGQDLVAAAVRAGNAVPRHWVEPTRTVDVFDAKADAMAALDAAGAPVGNLQVTTDAPDWYHPGRSGVFRLGATVLASFGEIHPGVLEAMEVDGPVVAIEVFLDRIPAPKKKTGPARPPVKLSPYQPVTRDFAFIVDESVQAERLVRAAKGADKALIDEVRVFDRYQGKGIPDGQKSIAIEVVLRPFDKTLTDEQIEAVAAKIVANVGKQTGATLRG